MNIITVNFKHVEILNYIRNEPATLKILFNDGTADRSIVKTTNIDTSEQFAIEIMNDIKKLEKEVHSKNSNDFLDVVVVRFGDDEEKVEEKLKMAFSRVREEIKKMKSPSAQGLLQRIASFKGSKYNI
ncbi:MAG: hypothetical protein AABW88_05020 [Nanoarchaeota archaeon]